MEVLKCPISGVSNGINRCRCVQLEGVRNGAESNVIIYNGNTLSTFDFQQDVIHSLYYVVALIPHFTSSNRNLCLRTLCFKG